MGSKGRTELQISRSRAKNVEEAAGDIRFYAFPPKTSENAEKTIFSLERQRKRKQTKFGIFARF